MSYLITYLLKMTLVSGVLYAYYYAVLRDKRFHQWNRFYLLSAVVLAILIPLFHIHVQAAPEDNSLLMKTLRVLGPEAGPTVVTGTAKAPGFWASLTWQDLVLAGYGAVVLGLLVAFAYKLWYIHRLYRRSPRKKLNAFTLVETSENGAPFSFFSWIFWNGDINLASPEGEHILRHELTHVRQRHTIDKIALQLACIVFFPVVVLYLIRSELQIIHEYLADNQAVRNEDTGVYAKILIGQAFQTSGQIFAHHFFQHPLKRRIAMMTHFKNPRFTYLRKILLLPIAFLLFGLLAFRAQGTHRAGLADTAIIISRGDTGLNKVLYVIDGKPASGDVLHTINPSSIESISVLKGQTATAQYGPAGANGVIQIHTKRSADTSGDVIFTKVEVEAHFQGGDTAWNDYVREVIIKHMNELQSAGQSGTCELQFIVDKNGYISDVQALTMQGSVLAKICAAAIQLGPDWVPARNNDKVVKSYRRQKITFQMPD